MLLDNHTLIPFAPDWSFALKHRQAHRSSVAEGVTGLEERAAWFTQPRRSGNYTITTDTAARTFAVEAVIRAAQESAQAAVPRWGREQIVAQAVGNTITLERSAGNFSAGQWVGAARPFGDITAATKIASVSGPMLTLDEALPCVEGDIFVPVDLGRIESVDTELLGGSGRAFEISFKGTTPLEAISAEFVFTETDTESNWLSILANLYFLFFIDTSGSMDADVPHVTAAANNLKVLLRDMIYGGDQEKADHFVRVQNWSSERWLDRLATHVSDEEAARYVSLAFINEASSGYHRVPRVPENEPTSSFTTDYNNFQAEFARREFSRCKVYSVDPTESSWEDDNEAFNAHLTAAVTGAGNYAALGPALSTQYVLYEVGIPSGRTAQTYLNDIFTLLGLR
jgi:hypothetical protein